MTVSVIIPTFNVAEYLPQALDSVLSQEVMPNEIIIVDNNSADNTLEVASGYKIKYPDLIKIHTEIEQGAPHARNRGLKIAIGEWIQFLDADDIISKSKLRNQINLVAKHPDISFIAGAFEYQYITGRTKLIIPHTESPYLALFRSNLGTTSANLWKRGPLLEISGWRQDLSSGQEYDLMFRLLKNNERVLADLEVLTYIRQRPSGQISNTNWPEVAHRAFDLKLEWKKFLQDRVPKLYQQHKDEISLSLLHSVLALGSSEPATAIDLILKNELEYVRFDNRKEYEISLLKMLSIKLLGHKFYIRSYHFLRTILKPIVG